MKLVEKWRLYALQQRLVDGVSMHALMPLGPLCGTAIQTYAGAPMGAVGHEYVVLPVLVVAEGPDPEQVRQDQIAAEVAVQWDMLHSNARPVPARPERPPGRLLKEGEVPPREL